MPDLTSSAAYLVSSLAARPATGFVSRWGSHPYSCIPVSGAISYNYGQQQSRTASKGLPCLEGWARTAIAMEMFHPLRNVRVRIQKHTRRIQTYFSCPLWPSLEAISTSPQTPNNQRHGLQQTPCLAERHHLQESDLWKEFERLFWVRLYNKTLMETRYMEKHFPLQILLGRGYCHPGCMKITLLEYVEVDRIASMVGEGILRAKSCESKECHQSWRSSRPIGNLQSWSWSLDVTV